MEELVKALKVVHSDSFNMYYKAHSYHWNVVGMDFPQLHDFFSTVYNEIWAAIDPIAEHIRTLDAFAPRGLDRVLQFTTIPLDTKIPDARGMIASLESANRQVLESLSSAHALAEQQGKRGIVNFLEDRIDNHEKHGWQLRSMLRS